MPNRLASEKNNNAKRRGKQLKNENNETNVTKRGEKPTNKFDSGEKEQSERSTSACKRNSLAFNSNSSKLVLAVD